MMTRSFLFHACTGLRATLAPHILTHQAYTHSDSVAVIVQQVFGGDIVSSEVGTAGGIHWFNRIGGDDDGPLYDVDLVALTHSDGIAVGDVGSLWPNSFVRWIGDVPRQSIHLAAMLARSAGMTEVAKNIRELIATLQELPPEEADNGEGDSGSGSGCIPLCEGEEVPRDDVGDVGGTEEPLPGSSP